MGSSFSSWVCGYANRQHDLEGEMSDDPEGSSFRKAMKLTKGTLLVLDAKGMPFQRIWCDFELDKTIMSETPLDVVIKKGTPKLLTSKPLPGEHLFDKCAREQKFPIQLLARGLQVSIENGNATVENDKTRILRSIATDGGRLAFNDDRLAQHLVIV